MNRNQATSNLPIFIAAASFMAMLFSCMLYLVLDEEEEEWNRELLRQCLLMIRERHKRARQQLLDDRPRKKLYITWDRERARQSIADDYLGPLPTFNKDGFKRMFRISRRNYENLRTLLCARDPFFRDTFDATRRRSISIDAKMLIALKYMSYGTAINAFRDYFQMGESTSRLCLRHFVSGVLHCNAIREKYFRTMSAADAKRVERMHYDVHGVRGMAFSLDCSHFAWGKCPTAYHGQYKGKEDSPTVVVEAGCDYQLWFWHCVFGYVGTMNDINIWDSSMLHKALHDGTFEKNDFPFVIGGETFNKLWFLTDGIYPELSRFVKTISEPLNKWEALYSLWQESSRKDVERGYGVLKKKFGFLTHPFQMYDVQEIAQIVYCCFILHNMAVEERVIAQDKTPESADFYDCVNDEVEEVVDNENRGTLAAMAFVQAENENAEDRELEIERLCQMGIDIYDPTLQQCRLDIEVLDLSSRLAHHRWRALYDYPQHKHLQQAIVRQLTLNYNNRAL